MASAPTDVMPGGMQDDFPLTLAHVLRRMRSVHGASEVVTQVDPDGSRVRATFAEVAAHADRLAAALHALGVRPGDRVGTFAWNSQEHLEAYYASTHVPRAAAVPELERIVTTRLTDGFEGGAPMHYRIAEMVWADKAAMERSAQSPEWAEMRQCSGDIIERFGVTLTVEIGEEQIGEVGKRA